MTITMTSRLAAFAALLWLGAAMVYRETCPSFGPATLLVPGRAPQVFAYPFQLRNPAPAKFVLVQQLWLPRFHPGTFALYPQDFVWGVGVNGHEVPIAGLPISGASHEGRSINLAPWLHPGLNTLTLRMEVCWRTASFQLAVSPWDFSRLALLAIVMGATVATVLLITTFFEIEILRPELMLLLAGMGLRYIYVCGTPYFARSFDSWGHAAYLDYVSRNLRLPPPGDNWEAFQAPLYYMLVGGVTRVLLCLGMAVEERYALWQFLALMLSIGLFIVGYVIAGILYEKGDGRRFFMLAVFAVAPPLVFNAARIGNDGLLALLSFTWLALLFHYWRAPSLKKLLGVAVVLGLALLTKANALSLLLVTALCLACDRRCPAKTRVVSCGLMLAVCGVIAGWYYLPRALQAHEVDTYVVGNLHSLGARAHIDGVFTKSLTFNPLEVIRHPFDDTWGPRNAYFLEVFFKTLLLGEWIKGAAYKLLARWMVLVALALVPAFLLGLRRAITRKAIGEEPLVATLAGVFVLQWLFLQFAPYLSTQDFRYSVILLVPLVYFFLEGAWTSSERIKAMGIFLLQIAVLNSAIYLLVLAL